MRIEAWCQDPETKAQPLDVLRDVIELKRVNNGLMKPTLIDDLVGDTYAYIYHSVGPALDELPLPPHYEQQLQQLQQPPPQQRPLMSVGGVMNVDGAVDPQHAQQYPPYVAQDGPGRPRTKGVGRRELQRRAEAAVTPQVRAPSSAAPVKPAGNQSVQVVLPSHVVAPNAAAHAANSAAGTVASSAAPSVHDDADDESGSELSELQDEDDVMDEVVVKPLFPNLARRESVADAESGRGTPVEEKKDDDKDQEEKVDAMEES